MDDLPSRWLVIARRWGSLVAWGVVAGAVVFLVLHVTGGWPLAWLAGLSEAAGPRGRGAIVLSAAVLAVAAMWPFGHGRWRAMLGGRHLLAYPPVWVAAVVGVAVLGGLVHLVVGEPIVPWGELIGGAFALPWWVWAGSLATLVLPPVLDWLMPLLDRLVRWWADHKKRKAEANQTKPNLEVDEHGWPTTFDGWKAWARDDLPIQNPADDRFAAGEVAERIAGRLVADGKDASIALVGQRGSGKSGIIQMVARKLQDEPGIVLVPISLWPYDTPEAPMRGVLDKLTKALGKHVGTLALSGLPGRYLAAIDHLAGRLGVLGALTRDEADPSKILQTFDTIAGAIGVRFVLAVEDFERFEQGEAMAGSGQYEDSQGQSRSLRVPMQRGQNLEPLRALLFLLHEREMVGVIMAATRLMAEFDLDKLARVVERVPPMPTDAFAGMYRGVRAAMYDPSFELIDPATDRTQTPFWRSFDESGLWNADQRPDERSDEIDLAIQAAISTPRSAKFALRQALDVWQRIPGEIDPDDLLVASIIRASSHEFYTTLSDCAQALRWYWNPGRPWTSEDINYDILVLKNSPDAHRLYQAMQGMSDNGQVGALMTLSMFLFPTLEPYFRDDLFQRPADVSRPQRLLYTDHTDYWRRMESMAVPQNEATDQGALRAIAEWRSDQGRALFEGLLDEREGRAIAHFASILPREKLEMMVIGAIDHWREHGWKLTGLSGPPPGFPALERIVHGKMGQLEPYTNALAAAIARAVPTNLPLAVAALESFARTDTRPATRVAHESLGDVYKKALNAFCKAFLASGFEVIEKALEPGRPGTLRRFFYSLKSEQGEHEPQVTPVDRWVEIAPFLIRFAQAKPAVGGRELAILVNPMAMSGPRSVEIRGVRGDPNARRLEENARVLFPLEDLAYVLRTIEDCPDCTELDIWKIQTARGWAQSFLEGGSHINHEPPSAWSPPPPPESENTDPQTAPDAPNPE